MDAPYGEVVEAGPGVRRVLARNPSPFTFTGTQTHIVGTGEVAVVDPGPDLPEHVDAILAAVRGERAAPALELGDAHGIALATLQQPHRTGRCAGCVGPHLRGRSRIAR